MAEEKKNVTEEKQHLTDAELDKVAGGRAPGCMDAVQQLADSNDHKRSRTIDELIEKMRSGPRSH